MRDSCSGGRSFASTFLARASGRWLTSGLVASAATIAAAVCALAACGGSNDTSAADEAALVEQGKQIFRFDTFGDEAQWTDTLHMHEVISAAVDPVTALSFGLKVDTDALPAAVVQGIQNGSVDLTRPATTVALLKLDASASRARSNRLAVTTCSPTSASPAPYATRRSTTRSRRASASGSTVGPIAI